MVTSIEQQYIDLHPESKSRYEVAKDLFPNGVTHDARNLTPFPYYVTHSEGSTKYDVDGNEIVDYKTGHGALILGHNHPAVVKAVQDQMAIGTHWSASTDIEIKWGQLVTELVPCAEKVRFNSSGTEADMMAMRMARAYTGKNKIIRFKNHFHGWSDYAVPGWSAPSGVPQSVLDSMIVLEPNDISLVEKAIAGGDVAAVILEPTGAHMGQEPIKPSFLEELRAVTEQNGVVYILDEVVTGFRISRNGASGYYGVIPDLSTHAKILGGGLPGACVAGKADIIDMLQFRDDPDFNANGRVAHNGTFNANPLSAAAGVVALEHVRDQPINDIASKRAEQLKSGLNEVLSRKEVPGIATGVESVVQLRIGLEIDSEEQLYDLRYDEVEPRADLKKHGVLAMYNHGVDGYDRFLLSAVHTEEDIAATAEALERTIDDFRAEGLL
jgi:glutamate-1-semialdehyde 2,1-aminomutase